MRLVDMPVSTAHPLLTSRVFSPTGNAILPPHSQVGPARLPLGANVERCLELAQRFSRTKRFGRMERVQLDDHSTIGGLLVERSLGRDTYKV